MLHAEIENANLLFAESKCLTIVVFPAPEGAEKITTFSFNLMLCLNYTYKYKILFITSF